jgi:hypothetical protein
MVFANSSGGEPFSNLGLNPESLFCVISLYGEFGSLDIIFPIFKLLSKLVLIRPGSISINLMPNYSISYAIDSDNPSKANFELT